MTYKDNNWLVREELHYFKPLYKQSEGTFSPVIETGVELKGKNYSLYISSDITTSPEYKNLYPKYQLEVNDNSKISGILTTTKDILTTGSISATVNISAIGNISSSSISVVGGITSEYF